jgi:hypothetical protein
MILMRGSATILDYYCAGRSLFAAARFMCASICRDRLESMGESARHSDKSRVRNPVDKKSRFASLQPQAGIGNEAGAFLKTGRPRPQREPMRQPKPLRNHL